MILHVVNDNVPAISVSLLRDACQTRSIEMKVHDAPTFLFAPENRATPGDLMFRPAISLTAIKVEQFLYSERVATFYQAPDGIFFNCNNALRLFEQSGIPCPRTFQLNSLSREALDYYVEQLGGYPVVLKVLGNSRGVGVMKLDSAQALYSVADYVATQAQLPLLCAYVDDAVHWRCVVVGDRVVAAYLNPPDGKDFRTYGTARAEDVFTMVDAEMEALAVAAVQALRLEFGGVDILRHASGRLYVLEANFPCYYAHAQETGGVDVAGAMVEHLLRKRQTLVSVG